MYEGSENASMGRSLPSVLALTIGWYYEWVRCCSFEKVLHIYQNPKIHSVCPKSGLLAFSISITFLSEHFCELASLHVISHFSLPGSVVCLGSLSLLWKTISYATQKSTVLMLGWAKKPSYKLGHKTYKNCKICKVTLECRNVMPHSCCSLTFSPITSRSIIQWWKTGELK